MKKWSKILFPVLAVSILFSASIPGFADDFYYLNMALHEESQTMYLTLKTTCGFEGYFTIESTPAGLVVPGYDNTISCPEEVCLPDYTCLSNFAVQVIAGLDPGDIASFHVEVFDTNDAMVGSVDDVLEVKTGTLDDNYFGYTYDCEPVVPVAVAQDEAYCLWLCHRTYVIPILTPPLMNAPPVFRIRPGCNEDLGFWDACSVDTCTENADETVLSWNVIVQSPTLGFLIVVYCDAAPGCACLKGPDWILPVELSAFAAQTGDGFVNLMWTTASETNNDCFNVQRRTDNTNWINVGRVEGHGTVATSTDYEFIDYSVMNGTTYLYRLISYDFNNARHEYNSIEATPGTAAPPTEYALEQNYPNPFNPQTTISYAIKDPGFVSLKVYNLIGQEVATLVSNTMEAGRYTVNFAGDNLPSGIYLYTLTAGEFTQTQKMLLLK